MAGFGEIAFLFSFFKRKRALEDGFDQLPAQVGHLAAGPSISLRSQALAKFQSRMTVFGETCKTSAVSSFSKPPKKRSSTTLAFLGSTASNRSRAWSKSNRSAETSGATANASSRG